MSGKNIFDHGAGTRLNELAQVPYDLTGVNSLSDERLRKYKCSSAHFSLYYATQRINDDVLDALQKLADESGLVDSFLQMKKGAVVNNIEGFDSEKRQVLHTATRDVFADAPLAPDATHQAKKELEKLEKFLSQLDDATICNGDGNPFDTMIHLGIGGSDLGPRSIFEALKNCRNSGRKVYFISNVDPDDAAAVLKQVNLKTTLVNIVSKSGTTLETLTNEELVRGAFSEAGLDPSRHCISVTGEGSPMDNPDNYLRSFYMYDYIGGRYSSTSMVGMVMLGFYLGWEQARKFLKGAATMDCEAEERDIRKNVPLLMALIGIWNHNFLDYGTLAVLPYSQALHRFPAHLQQCDMESNGKTVSRQGRKLEYKTGPIVWGEPGTNGQHAFYQLLHQGTEIVPVEFIGFRRSQSGLDKYIQGTGSQQKLLANLLAQSVALATGQKSENPNRFFPGNRPNLILMGDELTPETMGSLLALYEAKIVFQGFAWNLNSFDQEGVQLGKVLANRFLAHLRGDKNCESGLELSMLRETELL
jgi:glucose-6-phosphate isomerase